MRRFQPIPHLKSMEVFHGSNISGLKELAVNEDKSLLHGPGVYLTFSSAEARAYGSRLYRVKVTASVFDSTDESVLELFISTLLSSKGVSLKHLKNPSIKDLIKETVEGRSSGVFFPQGLFVALTEDPLLYKAVVQEGFDDDLDALLSEIKAQFTSKLIRVKAESSHWLIGLASGYGLEIVEETSSEPA